MFFYPATLNIFDGIMTLFTSFFFSFLLEIDPKYMKMQEGRANEAANTPAVSSMTDISEKQIDFNFLLYE